MRNSESHTDTKENGQIASGSPIKDDQNILLFRTNIGTRRKAGLLHQYFLREDHIHHWYIDLEDCDHVLKIEADSTLTEHHVISLLRKQGIACEILTD